MVSRSRPLAVLLSATALAGCVSSNRHEALVKAHDQTLAAHRAQRARAEALEERLGQLSAELAKEQEARGTEAGVRERLSGEVMTCRLERDDLEAQRRQAKLLARQLGQDLQRTAANLRLFAGAKEELEEAVAASEARARRLDAVAREGAALQAIVRDLTSELHAELQAGPLRLAVIDGRPHLAAPLPRWVNGSRLAAPGKGWLERVSQVLKGHANASVTVTEHGGRASSSQRLKRLGVVAQALTLGPDRVIVEVPKRLDGDDDGQAHPGDRVDVHLVVQVEL